LGSIFKTFFPTFSKKVIDMNKLLSQTARVLPAVMVFAAAAALSTGAHADGANKKALAVKLAQLQQKNESAAVAGQLADSVMQPMMAKWQQQIETRLPADKQKAVFDKLSPDLKKLHDSTYQTVQAQAAKTAQDALVPVFMNKLSEDDLKAIIAYLQTPASAKFAALNGDAAQAWISKIVESTKATVQGYAQDFDTTAEKVVSAAASAPAAPASTSASSAAAAPDNASASAPDNAPASASDNAPASSASDAQ
jgi:uncharacterized membrane protein YfbV (UPF0208 family)